MKLKYLLLITLAMTIVNLTSSCSKEDEERRRERREERRDERRQRGGTDANQMEMAPEEDNGQQQ